MKILFFCTNSFPYGSGEPLIPNKIKSLSSEFDKIFIISSSDEGMYMYELPFNVSHSTLSFRLSSFKKIIGLKNIFSKNVRNEIKYLLSLKKQSSFYKFLKIILNYYSISLTYKHKIKGVIKSEKLEKEDLYFYSYWCTEAVLGFTLLKSKYPHAKMYSRFHAYDLYLERHNPDYLPFRPFIATRLDKLFFISDKGKEYFFNRYSDFVDKDNLVVNRLGVSQELKLNDTKKNDLNFDLKIVSCSALIALKRIELMIETFALIEDLRIEWNHFGEGPLLDELMELCKNKLSCKKNIKYSFSGFIDNSSLFNYYNSNHVDIFLNTSKYEGVPISIMEAMAFKIPVIATNVGGVSEIVNSDNGYLLDVGFTPLKLKEILENFNSLSLEDKELKKLNSYNTWNEKYNSSKNTLAFISEIRPVYQVCTKCLYSNYDYNKITFDEEGVCEICHIYEKLQAKTVYKDEIGENKLKELISKIKKKGKNKTYDCIIGVSGGVDSSYVAFMAKKWGLKPLIIHVDSGWNSELAVKNIENILSKLDFNLHTHVLNWEEMKDLQRSFIKANVLDIDLPFDNSFMSILFETASKHGVKYILSGHNTVTEGWMPDNFTHYKLDTLNIRAIHKKFGTVKLSSFPLMGPLKLWFYKKIKGIELVYPLDYIPYNKEEVKKTLINDLGWRDYGGKHYESGFTKFYQGYILLKKFKIDKRVSHLSTLINSGQITRDEALETMKENPFDKDQFENDKTFFLKKLEFTVEEFDDYMSTPEVKHTNFSSYINIIDRLRKIKRFILNKN